VYVLLTDSEHTSNKMGEIGMNLPVASARWIIERVQCNNKGKLRAVGTSLDEM
jgi:hypothetical protein